VIPSKQLKPIAVTQDFLDAAMHKDNREGQEK
jgi:hypothetical protein